MSRGARTTPAGGLTLVPIQQLTKAELEGIAVKLESKAKGLLEHAEELRRYIKTRFPVSLIPRPEETR